MDWHFRLSTQTNGERVRVCFIVSCILPGKILFGHLVNILYKIADPFQWADLQMAKVPFSDDIIYVVLEKLKNDDWVEDLVTDLKNLFKVNQVWDNWNLEIKYGQHFCPL